MLMTDYDYIRRNAKKNTTSLSYQNVKKSEEDKKKSLEEIKKIKEMLSKLR